MKASIKICLAAVLSTSSWWSHSMVDAKSVFAHYMLSTLDPNTDHAKQDIDQAIAVGLDAFAVNVGAPGADFSNNTLRQLFDYARDKPFKLFLSFDFYAAGDIGAHQEFFNLWRNEAAYLNYGPQNLPVVSSFSGGSLGPDVWRNFKETNNVYLLPNLEGDADYYNNPTAFFQKWGNAIDGVFSWETAWPDASNTPVNVTSEKDVAVKNAADGAGKSYMMGLSSLQYKHCCGDSWYRSGETNLPERMTQILSLKPELTEVMTWNDAGESHYIGQCWPEGLPEEILQYGNSETYPHDGWQPLITSFINAFKNGEEASQMKPSGNSPIGALWYRGVMAPCDTGLRGSGAAVNSVNYAVVLPPTTQGASIQVSSGGQVLSKVPVHEGLNYNAVGGMVTGPQKLEILDQSGAVIASASSKVDVSNGPQGGFCNFNYYVAGLQ